MARALVLIFAFLLSWTSSSYAQQVLFLAPVDGTGTDADPRIARGLLTTPGIGCIDLQAVNRFICAADSYPAGVVQLATIIDRLNPARKAAIEAVLGITLTADDPMEVIAELLITHARTDGTRWRPLRKDPDGTYKIYLGSQKTPRWRQTAALYPYIRDNGMVADLWNSTKETAYLAYHYTLEPAVAWATTLATENFTGTDGDLNGRTFVHPWTEFTGTAWAIVSNQAKVTASTASNEARADAALASVDHAVQATFVSVSGDRCSLISRKDNTATRTFYMLTADPSFGGWRIMKSDAGTRTILTGTSQTINANDVGRVEPIGSSISGYVNNTLTVGPTTDTTITTGTYGGIATHSSGPAETCIIDDWSAYDIIATSMLPRRRTY